MIPHGGIAVSRRYIGATSNKSDHHHLLELQRSNVFTIVCVEFLFLEVSMCPWPGLALAFPHHHVKKDTGITGTDILKHEESQRVGADRAWYLPRYDTG